MNPILTKLKNKKFIVGALLVVLLAAGLLFYLSSGNNGPKFKTQTAARGDIRAAVTATGTMNAVTTVLVGTQVSGTISKLYVDFNSPVKKGEILAQIDPATFQAQVDQARANLQVAQANVQKAEAGVIDTKRTMERNKTLFARNFIAKSDVDTAETNYLSAEAQLSASKGAVAQTRAALDFAETNFRYTKIISPVDGTVISRNIDVGQTVAASFQTPTLFNIAQDLTRMQIDTSVDEADIGKIKVDQPVEFSVDAYPDITFRGKVSEVRNAPITVQNVVTYDVVVKVDNPELKLKPGMTANVSIILDDKKGVLRVPNAALRFRPAERSKETPPQKGSADQKGSAVWVLENDRPKRTKVTSGISDGNYTEILSGDLKEGDAVIVESIGVAKKSDSPIGGQGMFK
jgi:HlyD family secretion protein